MKFKELGTIAAAGILSLAALVLLEQEEQRPGFPARHASGEAEFEDDSSLLEPSAPAPTAEPPVESESEESPQAEAETVYESTGGSDPVPVPTDEDGKPVSEPLDEPHPDLGEIIGEINESPDSETGDSSTDTATADLADNGSREDPEKEGGISKLKDTFTEAVSQATGGADSPGTDASPPLETKPASSTQSGGGDAAAGEEPASIIEETPSGFWLREAKLNDVFQHLSQLGNYQYFHNAELAGPSYVVTGQLQDDDPIKQMEELALMYGVTIHTKGNTVYALTDAQLSQLPNEHFRYQLKYLRPDDIEQIKLILNPFLTPGSGIIEYESKTNTLIAMDNVRKLEALEAFLEKIDQPKQQIAIETRILRITSSSSNRIGVDWSAVLGEDGLSFGGTTNLNALFNLPSVETVDKVLTSTGTGGSLEIVDNNRDFTLDTTRTTENNDAQLVLSPVEINAVLRALNAGGLAQQESSPTLITEDNEEGLISIIDRIPIITSTISETDAGQNISEEVRYTIDEDDPTGDPASTREVGVSVSVTPTILPDETIRMSLRPRSAQVVEFIESPGGNMFPRVNESSVTTTARVPNGHSLLIGGFYEEIESDDTNKVPVLGDIPAVNLLFKSKSNSKEHTSLVFIVTPRLYRPASGSENDRMTHDLHESHVLPGNHDYPDRRRPGHNYESDFRNTVNNAFEKYDPDPPSNLLHPAHPYNLPQARPVHGKDDGGQDTPRFHNPSVEVRAADARRKKGGLLGKLFGADKSNRAR